LGGAAEAGTAAEAVTETEARAVAESYSVPEAGAAWKGAGLSRAENRER